MQAGKSSRVLQELEYLNMAVNNLTRIQNLQRCESLQKLDLTVNFLDKAGLLSVQSLQRNENLAELYLVGNPCTEWPGYRPFIVGTLPRLKKLVCLFSYSRITCRYRTMHEAPTACSF